MIFPARGSGWPDGQRLQGILITFEWLCLILPQYYGFYFCTCFDLPSHNNSMTLHREQTLITSFLSFSAHHFQRQYKRSDHHGWRKRCRSRQRGLAHHVHNSNLEGMNKCDTRTHSSTPETWETSSIDNGFYNFHDIKTANEQMHLFKLFCISYKLLCTYSWFKLT